jgi:methionyl-tRNA synthetase
LLGTARAELEVQAFHRMLDALWAVVGAGNRYVDEQAPWALKKNDPPRMSTVLYVLAETIRHVAILTQPVMPGASARILDQLAVPVDVRGFEHLGPAHALTPGVPLPVPQGVFPRYIDPAKA